MSSPGDKNQISKEIKYSDFEILDATDNITMDDVDDPEMLTRSIPQDDKEEEELKAKSSSL